MFSQKCLYEKVLSWNICVKKLGEYTIAMIMES